MSYQALARRKLQVRPLAGWPGRRTPEHEREPSRFTAQVFDTVGVLARELDHLDGTNIVLNLGDPAIFQRLQAAKALIKRGAARD